MEHIIIIALIIVLLILWGISTQRKLVALDENVNNAMNQIGVQLSSQLEALTALAELTKGCDENESVALLEEIKSHGSVIGAYSTPEDVSEQERVIEEVLDRIEAVAKQYPELRESGRYAKMRKAVDSYENMVRTSGLIYNDSVTRLNRAVRLMPNCLIAGLLGFSKREYMEGAQEKEDKTM